MGSYWAEIEAMTHSCRWYKDLVRRIWICLLIGWIAGLPMHGSEAMAADSVEDFNIEIFVDKNAAGWAFKNNDVAFAVSLQGCSIQWNAIDEKANGSPKQNQRYLSVRQLCNKPFSELIYAHRKILAAIEERFPLNSFSYLIWPGFCPFSHSQWCVPVAQASLHSSDYQDYRQNYPHSKIVSLNDLYVDLANRHAIYQPLAKLFYVYGLDLQLSSVEKVFAYPVTELPGPVEFSEHIRQQNPSVLYDVGMAVFGIKQR